MRRSVPRAGGRGVFGKAQALGFGRPGIRPSLTSSHLRMFQVDWNFPGGPVVKTPHFHCKGHGFNPSSPWSEKFHMPYGATKKQTKKNLRLD